MTRHGIVCVLYSKYVEPRPASRFTDEFAALAANDAWTLRAVEWGNDNVDDYGHYIGDCSHEDFRDTLTGAVCNDCGLEADGHDL